MKSLQIMLGLSLVLFSIQGIAQTKTEKIKVAGECGTCKKKIETAAKNAGASYALWNTETKLLVVKYNSTNSSTAKIERSIANAGYDTPQYKATDEAYNKLDACCQYARATADSATSCCDAAACKEAQCMKNGKCDKDMACCKQSGCTDKSCCKHDQP